MFLYRLAIAATGLTLSAGIAAAAPTAYPHSVDNCGFTLEFAQAPENVVTIGQGVTEILYSLGAGQNMAGTALWFAPVLPQFEEINSTVEQIEYNIPSFEGVINKRPGLVATQFEWMIGEQGVVGSRPQFHDLSVPTYIMPDDCEGKDNLVGADGTRLDQYTPDLLYKGITELAAIFDRQDEGEALIADLKERVANAAVQAETLDLPEGASAVFWFSSPDLEMDPYVAGALGPSSWIMKTLGLENVIESAEEWPTVGWETIARANPTYIVIAEMERRRFPADDHEVKLEFLKSDPVTSLLDAVQNDRIIIMGADAMQSSLRTVYGLEGLIEAIAEKTQ